jgi:hypothetical protein
VKVSRRDALKMAAVAPIFRLKPEAIQSGFRLQAEDPTVSAIAEAVLPAEADRKAAVTAFTRWIANYKEGADTDHGYGNTRVRSTGPSPARNYAAQIAALEAAAKAKGATGFVAASLDQRRAIVEAAITDAKIERISARPTGAHIITDLMGHYFNSPVAQDLCYRAAIGRDACRGLPGSEKKPTSLPPKSDLPPKGGSYR